MSKSVENISVNDMVRTSFTCYDRDRTIMEKWVKEGIAESISEVVRYSIEFSTELIKEIKNRSDAIKRRFESNIKNPNENKRQKTVCIYIFQKQKTFLDDALKRKIVGNVSELIRFCLATAYDQIYKLKQENAVVMTEDGFNRVKNGLIGNDHPSIVYLKRKNSNRYEKYVKMER